MPPEPWTEHVAIRRLRGPIQTRLGVSPHHPSFQVGALRTHLLTAALAHAAARSRGTTARVLLRWDDTDAARASSENEHLLRAELADVAEITLRTNDNQPKELHQSERRRPYREALDRLAGLGLTQTQDGCTILDLLAIDAHLAATGVDPDGLARERIVNGRTAPRPQHGTVRLARSDGTALWHLATVVDDTEAGVNFVVRGIDKIDATSIQERLRAVLAPKEQVAYLFLPRLRPAPGAAKTRVADVRATGISTAALLWFLVETYVIGEEPATTFDEVVERLRPVLPKPRDSQLDLQRLAAMERQLARADRRTPSSPPPRHLPEGLISPASVPRP